MHLNDVLRLWRTEVLQEAPETAVVEEAASSLGSLLGEMPRDSLPGGLRRDEPAALQVRLLPASHHPGAPASDHQLDRLEEHLGFELPQSVELLLRLHNGGDFFRPEVEGLPAPHAEPLRLLSCDEMSQAYLRLLSRIAERTMEWEDDQGELFRAARRFGAMPEQAEVLADQLAALRGGQRLGLQLLPLMLPPGRPDDLICFAPLAGREGRVGYASAITGFLPDHSDEYPFDGVEGWLQAILKSRGCRRVLLS